MGEAKRNKRDCPALNRLITPAECGENRATRYACPSTCPHNPWAPSNYELSLELNYTLLVKSLSRLRDDGVDLSEIAGMMHGDRLEAEMHFIRKFFREPDTTGMTFLQRWERDGWRDLNNDQRFLFSAQSRMAPALIEVWRVINDHQCEVMDLLAPERKRFVIQDTKLAGFACRFDSLIGWLYPMPHYDRMHGIAKPLPEISGLTAFEVTHDLVAHLGGPTDSSPLRDWISLNFVQICRAIDAVAMALQDKMFESLDAKFCAATYKTLGPLNDLAQRLMSAPSIQPGQLDSVDESDGFLVSLDVFEDSTLPGTVPLPPLIPSDRKQPGNRELLGKVVLSRYVIRLSAISGAKYQALRTRFENLMEQTVQFQSEFIRDMAAEMRGRRESWDATLVPPQFLTRARRIVVSSSKLESMQETPDMGSSITQHHLRQTLDQPVPALDNRTPRDAACDPAMRSKIVNWTKSIVNHHDRSNLTRGQNEDINWLIEELGLNELNVPPPPLRSLPDNDDQ